MSREYPTVNESIAYDDGFKDAEDYWVPRTEERIIGVLEGLKAKCEHKLSISKSFTGSSSEAYIALQAFQVAIALIKGEK